MQANETLQEYKCNCNKFKFKLFLNKICLNKSDFLKLILIFFFYELCGKSNLLTAFIILIQNSSLLKFFV